MVFSYTGLPADDMAGRIVTFYERSLPNSVNDIEHIESQSIANYGIIKIFFQPTVNINAALAQVNGMSQTVLKQMPPGITPPLILSFNASSVPILQLALSSDKMSETQIFDSALNFIRPALAPVPGAALPLPFGGKVRQVQADLNQQALHQYGVSANDVINALSLQNLITPVGTQKIGSYEYTVNLNDSPKAVQAFNDLPVKTVNGTVIYMRDVAYVHDGSPPQTNAVHVNGSSAVLLTIMKSGASSTQPEADRSRRSIGFRDRCGVQRRQGRRDRGRTDRDDDPFVPRQLALDPHHHALDPAGDPGRADRTFIAGRDDQRDDTRRPRAGGRNSGRRRDRHHREHQLAS